MLIAGICLSFVGSALMAALWGWGGAFKIKEGHLWVAPNRGKRLMIVGQIGLILLSIGFLLQLIHACC